MATATYSVTTGSSDLSELWRKVQIGVLEAYQFGVEEWMLFQKAKKLNIDWSSREITAELDFNDDINVASIPEGGKEARPASPTAVTATLTWILLNARFTISLTSEYIQKQQGTRGQLVNQFKWQSKKKVQAVRRKVGDMLYGFSNGVVGHLTENNTGTTSLDLDNMYGVTGLGGTSDARKVSDLVRANEYYGILTSAGTFREIVQASSVASATNIVTTASNMSTTADGDLLVGAASLENTTNAGTDYNRGLVGLLDMLTSTSVHSVSGDTYPRWTASTTNTDGGRFTGIKLRKLKQGINNEGGGKLDTVLWSQGVENDVTAQLQAGLRFSDSWGMEMDGSPKSKGIKFVSTKRVPDGYVIGFDSKRSVCRGTLLPEPDAGQLAFGDGHKLQDDSGRVYSIDYPCFMMTKNRKNMGYYSGLTEQ
jgi:hypothetical protein